MKPKQTPTFFRPHKTNGKNEGVSNAVPPLACQPFPNRKNVGLCEQRPLLSENNGSEPIRPTERKKLQPNDSGGEFTAPFRFHSTAGSSLNRKRGNAATFLRQHLLLWSAFYTGSLKKSSLVFLFAIAHIPIKPLYIKDSVHLFFCCSCCSCTGRGCGAG